MASAQSLEKHEKKGGLSFKLSGGLGYLLNGAGDINNFRKGLQQMISDQFSSEGYTHTFNWSRPRLIPDLTADIIIHVGSHIGFGFGTGLISGSSKGSYSINYYASKTSWGEMQYTVDRKANNEATHRITAIPLKFDLYFFQPVGTAKKFTFFAHGGVGYYLGKANFDYPYHFVNESIWRYSSGAYKYFSDYQVDMNGKAKCNTWGYHAGIGLEFKMSRAISFGAELFGRSVNFKNWEGDLSASWKEIYKSGTEYSWLYEATETGNEKLNGFLWTYQIHNYENNKDYTSMMLFEKQPTDSDFKNPRKSAINLNTLSIVFSVTIHFDLF